MNGQAGWFRAAGKWLEYRDWPGAPDATPILLMHEGLGCVALWKGFPQAIQAATGRRVVAYSRAGYGQSDADDLPRPLDWMTAEATALTEVFAALNLTRPLLLGHSDGASIAAIRAGLWQDVAGVALIAPHFFTEPMGLAQIHEARRAFQTTKLRDRMARYHRDPVATFNGWADAWLDPAFEDWSIEDVLDGITCPVLALQGRADEYGTLAQIDAVTDRLPARRAILDGLGHSPHLEATENVLAEIIAFMQNNALI